MLKFDHVKVLGIRETIETMKAAGFELPGDSYGTHIEDGETLETSGYSYTVGELDLAYILSNEKAFNTFSDGVIVYAVGCEDGGEKHFFVASYADIYKIADQVKEGYEKDFWAFVSELPFMKDILDHFDVAVEDSEEEAEEE